MSCEQIGLLKTTDKTLKGLENANSMVEINKLANNAVTTMTKTYEKTVEAMNKAAEVVEVVNEVYSLVADPAKIVEFLASFVASYAAPHIESYIKNSETMVKLTADMAALEQSYNCVKDKISLNPTAIPQLPNDMSTTPSLEPDGSTLQVPTYTAPTFSFPSIQ